MLYTGAAKAGATLALWAGHNTSVLVPALVVAIAPISDLEAGHDQKLSDEGDAVLLYMKGTPADLKDAYAAASPIKLLPVKTNTLIVAGTADTDVPATHIAPYAEAAKQSKGDHLVTYLPMEGADHWALVDVRPTHIYAHTYTHAYTPHAHAHMSLSQFSFYRLLFFLIAFRWNAAVQCETICTE